MVIRTNDRPGLLTDIVHNMKDINVNVISAEVHINLKCRQPLFIHAGSDRICYGMRAVPEEKHDHHTGSMAPENWMQSSI